MSESRSRSGAVARAFLVACLGLTVLSGLPGGARAADLSPGIEHLRAGRTDQALAFFEEAGKHNPNDVKVLNMIGATLCLRNRTLDSIPYFEKALRIDQSFSPARKNLALAEFNLGRYDDAKTHWLSLLEAPALRAQASLFLGMIASEQRQHKDAVRHFEQAGDLINSQPQSLIGFARSLGHEGDSVRADDLLGMLRGRSDLTAADYADIAALLSARGRHEEALADLARAEQLDPRLPGLGYYRVDLLAKAGRSDEALALAEDLSNRSPDGRLLTLLAEIAEGSGKLETAIEALRTAIQIEPRAEDHYLELSALCTKYRNSALALEILDLGLRQLPRSYRLLVQKGITLGHSQNHDEAKKVFSRAIALGDDHSVALAALAVSQLLSGEMPEALTTLRGGLDRFPKDFYIHYLYGFALDRSRAEKGAETDAAQMAVSHLRTAIRLSADFSSAYYRLGKLLIESDPDAAIRNLEAAVRLNPDSVAAKYQLGQLYLDQGRREEGARLMNEVGEAKQKELEQEQKPQFRVAKVPSRR